MGSCYPCAFLGVHNVCGKAFAVNNDGGLGSGMRIGIVVYR